MCDGLGITPYTFLSCLCVQPRFIEIYGSSGSVGSFVEGAALRQIYSMTGCVRRVGRDTIRFTYRCFQKDYSLRVHDALSSSQRLLRQARAPHRCITPEWLLISKLLNPRPANQEPGRSGPNYCLPSPRRAMRLCRSASFPAGQRRRISKTAGNNFLLFLV